MHYEALADYYDILINDEDGQNRYASFLKQWISFIERPDLLELACGSGMLARLMADSGYDIDASDVSESMIEVAKQTYEVEREEKTVRDTFGTIHFFTMDMKDFSLAKQYDAIYCFCDSINYLLSGEDVLSMFASVHRHLKPGGLFLFDCHSIDRLSEFAQGYEEANILGDLEYQWNINTVHEEIHQRLQVWDDSYYPVRYFEEEHIQRVYDSTWLIETLNKSGFGDIEIKTDFDLPGVVSGEKQFYICRRTV